MVGVSLSRWTMSYFAAALVALLVAEFLMTIGYGFPAAAQAAPETLILVHIVAIGWLSLLMCGALLQFVPVLVVQPLHSDRLALPALGSLIAGLAALIIGFLQLAGHVDRDIPAFALAGVLLGSGFALVVWNLGRTVVAAQTIPLASRFVVAGLACMAATAGLGIIFALVFGGTVTYRPLAVLTGAGLPVHVVAGLGGWLSFTAMGVSYRLLAMFMLAPELEGRTTKGCLYLGVAALVLAIGGGVLTILFDQDPEFVLLAAAAVGLMALMLYGGDVLHLYRARKRRHIELNSRMAALALASLAASVALIIVLLPLGRLTDHIGAVVFLIAFGWLSGLGLAQLYKIVAFLTWLECYGPVLGKAPTPRVQDLVTEARALKWFVLYFLAVWTGTIALLASAALVFQITAAAMLIASGGIVAELVRTRRLADVKAVSRLPLGVQRPRLLLSYHA
ncbi:MAG: hypothetical protein OJF62_000921 [Pseudolabrys sp.]|jgi:hypothetical protein|nr:hypothetical protein [Pseudolabrys sp.]